MDEKDIENADSDFAELILIMQSIWNDEEDKDWEENKDWLLDDNGDRIYL